MKKLIGQIVNDHPQYAKLANDLLMANGLVAQAGITIDVVLKDSSRGHKRRTPSDFRIVYNPEKFERLPDDLQEDFIVGAFDQIIRNADSTDRLAWRVVQCEVDDLEESLNSLDNQGYDVDPKNVMPIHKDAKVVWQIIAKVR
jgi:hypothetical protein